MNQRWLCGVVVWVLMMAAGVCSAAPAGVDAFEQNKRLGRGVNVIGYDPIWRDRTKARFQAEHFRLLREAGFNHIRVNLHPFRVTGPGPEFKLPDAYLQTLDWVLDQALANKLMVILDFHEFTTMAKDPVALKGRYLAIWTQLAEHCKDQPGDVVFELLNEPNGKLTVELWNEFLVETLGVIRKSNPARTVIIGPGQWNGIGQLDTLRLPEEDRNLIVTVHYYSPMEFTHQGAPWSAHKDKSGVTWTATDAQKQVVEKDFDKAQAWSKQQRRPIYLGEFGAYDKADMDSRVRYTNFVAREAEKRGWSWGYWQFDSDFVVYDIPNSRWVEPIRDALIPPRP